MGAHGTLQEALANVKVSPLSTMHSALTFLRWLSPAHLSCLCIGQAYHDASTDEDREAGKSKHKKHKKEKKRKRAADDAPANGSKKRKKVRLASSQYSVAAWLRGSGVDICHVFGVGVTNAPPSIAKQPGSALASPDATTVMFLWSVVRTSLTRSERSTRRSARRPRPTAMTGRTRTAVPAAMAAWNGNWSAQGLRHRRRETSCTTTRRRAATCGRCARLPGGGLPMSGAKSNPV